MARLLLLTDSNYIKNSAPELYKGPRIKNLEVKNCQNKRTLFSEMSGMREGIMVIACLDLIAAEAATTNPDLPDRAVELAFNHIVWKVMDLLEEADGKLACGIVAPVFWLDHSDTVTGAMNHAYKIIRDSPVTNLYMTDYASGLKIGPDRVHLMPRAGFKYVRQVNDVFVQIEQELGLGIVEVEGTIPGGESELDDAGFDVVPPQSPSRTLSMVSATMLNSNFGKRQATVQSSNSGRQSAIVQNLVRMANPGEQLGSAASSGAGFQPYTGPFVVPPPPPPNLAKPISGPTTWPTMMTPELNASLVRIERSLGQLEAKSFFDNMMMASLQEEVDTEANIATLNRITVVGIRIPSFSRMTGDEKVSEMKKKVQSLVNKLQNEGQVFEVVFVRHLNRQVRGLDNTVIEVKFANDKQAKDLRSNFVQRKKDTSDFDSINIAPVVRLATRVRIEMMHSIANAVKQNDPTIERAFCVQFIPKPLIKIVRKDRSGNEVVRNMSFLEAVSWVKEVNQEKTIDFKKAYERAGSAFRGTLQQTFVILRNS
jgi:hypothetical protein